LVGFATSNFTPGAGADIVMESISLIDPSGTPLFNCTATMLEACGYATWETPDPSGRYVFFQVSPDNTLIAKIELAQQRVVETGNYINGFVVGFSPDDVLVYTQNQQVLNPSTYSIYVFDPATGGVTYSGGQIEAQTEVRQFVPALRR
jgi:DNA-binding beta-propeller fold protein YncE